MRRRAILIDGVQYDTVKAGAEARGLSYWSLCKYLNCGYASLLGHAITYADEAEPLACLSHRRRPGSPLLVEPCVHRLGVYLGGAW
jgi:hypothetical protein